MKLSDLLSKIEKLDGASKQSQNGPDDRFWKPSQDETGNGYARIRFLPNKDEDELPFVKLYQHGFQNEEGRWFIEECPTTIGHQCPLCTANSKLWNSGIETDKEIARARKRKVRYIANVLVVEDPKNKDNEGKTFLFSFGQKIFDKIMDKMKPAFADETPINPFDSETGADLKLKIRKVAGYTNYDKSEFASETDVSNRFDNDELIDLKEFVNPTKFKSAEEIEAKLNKFIGLANEMPVSKKATVGDSDSDSDFVKKAAAVVIEKPQAEKKVVKPAVSDDDDDLDYFKKLAADLD